MGRGFRSPLTSLSRRQEIDECRLNSQLKVLIVGTGRCGTGYVAKSLEQSGISCGHEAIFNHWSEERIRDKLRGSKLEAESSWAAAPFLGAGWLPANLRVVHLTRSPVSVVKSFHDINFFSKEREQKPLNQIVYRNTSIRPETQDRLASSVTHYYEWNALIVERLKTAGRPSLVLRLEDLISGLAASEVLSSFLGMEVVLPDEVSNRKVAEKRAQGAGSYDAAAALSLMEVASRRFGSFGYPL